MNFMPATVEGDVVKLPMLDAPEPRGLLDQLGDTRDGLIAGIRPETFEDAALVGDKRNQGIVFRTRIEVVESLGSELYAHFNLESEGVQSQELQELAEDAGTADVPGAGEGKVVARLDAASGVQEGQEAELWLDTTKIHFFRPDGSAIRTDEPAPASA
jgi:multiple sugar transport system ATP-binding protein